MTTAMVFAVPLAFAARVAIVGMVQLPRVVIPVPCVIAVFDVTHVDDVPITMLDQSRREMARFDIIPGPIVVGSAVPHASPGRVIIVVDIEEAKGNPHGHIKAQILWVKEQRWL